NPEIIERAKGLKENFGASVNIRILPPETEKSREPGSTPDY
ncbi:6189_t:CDS:1, partial [Acaulospora colombiana]